MAKYTYGDIIINPYSDEAKSCIDKKIYFADSLVDCLAYANRNDGYFLATLKEINPSDTFPFKFDTGDSLNLAFECMFIIPQKEEPKYVPFKNREEFLNAFKDNTPIMHVYGLWIYEKIGEFDENVPRLITEMWGDGVVIGSDNHTTTWKELLERFVFENNEPCGKLQEKTNE